jgi:hypothetical protein
MTEQSLFIPGISETAGEIFARSLFVSVKNHNDSIFLTDKTFRRVKSFS